MNDLIDRQAAIDAINGLIDRFERILRDIRETNGDDSVCGMCEYDGAYIGQSGDWCNECPGFDKEDCFKLSDECRKRWLKSVDLPSAQPEQRWIPCSERLPEEDGYYLVTNSKWGAPWREITLWVTDGWSSDNKPIAWMPLPEPWKGEKMPDKLVDAFIETVKGGDETIKACEKLLSLSYEELAEVIERMRKEQDAQVGRKGEADEH